MTHARTLPRYVGAAGLAAGLLVAFPSLSHAATGPYTITELKLAVQRLSSPMNVSTPPNVPGDPSTAPPFRANARVSLRDAPGRRPLGGTPIYTTIATEIPRSTVRAGALSALGRGVMHPGFQAAILAAGLFWSQQDGIHKLASGVHPSIVDNNINPDNYEAGDGACWYASADTTQCFSNALSALTVALNHFSSASGYNLTIRTSGTNFYYFNPDQIRFTMYRNIDGTLLTYGSSRLYRRYTPPNSNDLLLESPQPATQTDIENIDSHIPPELVDQLWNGEPIPEWQDAITVLGPPATWVQPTGEQAVAPEVALAAGRWAENVLAQLNGQSAPNPDAPVTSNTSVEQYYEERLDDDGPPPSFSDVDIDWQVEEIDQLPSYDIGIGSGQCPPPTVITLPFPLNSNLVINWQPFCDLAAMIRGAVIAVAMILSLYIVLRRG